MKQPPDDLIALLKGSGLPWRIDNGGKHYKIMLAGHLAAILPRNGGWPEGRAHKNMIAQIRRALRARCG
jgi:hypothetical protein